MRRFLFQSLIFSVFSIFLLQCSGSGQTEQPNFLFILVDDLGYMDVGFNNPETFYETVHIDKLAEGAVRFTNGYAACPVCSPTRASIQTGTHPARLATTDYFGAPQPENWKRNTPLLPASYREELPLEEVTIAEILKQHGYQTFYAGKWHLGEEGFWPGDQGYDVNKGGWTRGGPYGGKKYFSPYGNPRLEDGPEGEHLPDRLATETAAFMETNRDEPFLAFLSFYSVHTPLIGRPDLVEKYERKRAERGQNDTLWGDEGHRKVRLVQEHAVYAAMVEAMDLAVGKVLNKLEDLELEENTVVIFMSDNGGLSTSEGHPTSNLPLRAGKGWLYEGGIREPMLIRWPGVAKRGSVDHTPVISTDFYPTMLEMAGIDLPSGAAKDGVSLVPLLKDGQVPAREAIFWHYPHYGNQGGTPGAAVRAGKYKYIEFFDDTPPELYDLEADISEKENLSECMPEKAAELKELLRHWQQSVQARLPAENDRFDPDGKVYH